MIRVIACGKMREKWMKDGASEYLKRIGAYDKTEVIEVQDEKAPQNNSEADNRKVMEIEGERLLKAVRPNDYVILLDLAGETCDSEGLARKITELQTHGQSRITFVIGGSLGLSDAVKQRADFRWKLSDNTFPHQLCRVIVLEQIYRAFKIMNHEPYHK
ncbi:MAG: 23S rRNA (pseudouridine(1915)-N(3))-methyltransferase RlmH [Erysipelotrichaceae bacterium]|nr:23S rRNA (pseudouridine(1915)-N(3))-methyltransferase RlmH [Solobacterium sp.]MDO4193465.1 23S rRNA (pseudouridine(1915)-N(3))-methyltransferase RlmH [Erysipelotrichaceae bacterium]MDO5122187.1 23S rRNA (pseudouridine(1915)-N(3))-methyltransferase RlmH [Erysipelotrichaceae bacterium]